MINKENRWFSILSAFLHIFIGFFLGCLVQKNNVIKDNAKHKVEMKKACDDIEFWKEGYLSRDSALQKISNHKKTPFEIKSIIGDIE